MQCVKVLITPGQRDWADWAIDPMFDYWCTEDGAYERGGELVDSEWLPYVRGTHLVLPLHGEIIADLLYRLEVQAPDVAETDAVSEQQVAARSRPAIRLGEKIRSALAAARFELPEQEESGC